MKQNARLIQCRAILFLVAAVGIAPLAGCGQSGASSPSLPTAAADSRQSAENADEGNAPSTGDAARAAEQAKTAAPTDNATPSNIAKPTEIIHKAPQQVATGGDGRARNITFDALKFPMENPKGREFKAEMLTDSIEKLSGTRVRIRGFILPVPVDEVSQFVLVRDNQECCFGPGSALYDSVMVNLEPGKTARFQTRPVTVEGEFRIREVIGPDKKHWSIYHIQATKVE